MKIKHIITTIVMFLIVTPSVNAKVICDKADILRVKGDANKILIDYSLSNESPINGLFDLTITGITEDLSIVETTTNKRYTINSAVDGVIIISNTEGNNLVFKVYYDKCSNTLVRTIKLNLPKYNYYSEDSLCDGISKGDLEVCDPWYQGELTDEIFKQKIDEYQKNLEIKKQEEEKENTIFNQIKNFLLDYYIYIITTIVLIVIITLLIVFRKKRYSLE